jgi:hypothetical protein
MQDEEILGIIHNALSFGREIANDVNIRVGVRGRVVPATAKMHSPIDFGSVSPDSKYLYALATDGNWCEESTFSSLGTWYLSIYSLSETMVIRYRCIVLGFGGDYLGLVEAIMCFHADVQVSWSFVPFRQIVSRLP